MARIDVPFVVEKQHIVQSTREKLVAGGQNYFYATFKICDKWVDIDNLKAVFVRENVNKLIRLNATEEGYECKIPWEVMTDKGSFQVGVFGGDKLLTDYAYVIVKEGCVTDGKAPTPPTPDWFTEMEEKINRTGATTDDVLDINSRNPISNSAVTEALEIMQSGIDGIGGEVSVQREDIDGLYNTINQHAHFKGYFATNAKLQSTEATPNDFAYSAESGTKWVYEEGEDGCVWVDTGIPVPDQMTPASDTTPLVNGTASVGTENAYARGDHRHPIDASRASATEVSKLKNDVANLTPVITKYGNVPEAEHHIVNNSSTYYDVIATSLVVSVDEVLPTCFISALYFTTPSEIPNNYTQFPADIHFKGDGTDDEAFVPEADTRYTIAFVYDGLSLVGYVSGVTV